MCSQYSLVLRVASYSCIRHFHGTTCNWCQKMRFGQKLVEQNGRFLRSLSFELWALEVALTGKTTLTVHIPETSELEYLLLHTRAFLYYGHLLALISGCKLKASF